MRLRKSLIATIVSLVLTASLPTLAIAWNGTCNPNQVCVWRGAPYVLPKAADPNSDYSYEGDKYPSSTYKINNTVSSIKNKQDAKDAIWYFDPGYTGTNFCLKAGWVSENLNSHNDKYSSHVVASDDDVCPD